MGEKADFTIHEIEGNSAEIWKSAVECEREFVKFNPGNCILNITYRDIAQQVLDAPVRKDDIWLISCPRTGSTWCQEMIWLLNNNLDFEKAENIIQQRRAPLLESTCINRIFKNTIEDIVGNSVEYINNLPSPRYIKTHLPLNLLPKQLDIIKPKMVYICRNPKDVCVSYYHFTKNYYKLNFEFEEFCELLLNGYNVYGPILDHYRQFWNKRNEPNVLFLKYEEMIKDVKDTLKRIAQFFGKSYSEDQYDQICDFLSFDKMRDNKGCNGEILVNKVYGENYYKNSGYHFFRKGKVGDYKNYMTPEMEKRFDEWIEKNLGDTRLLPFLNTKL